MHSYIAQFEKATSTTWQIRLASSRSLRRQKFLYSPERRQDRQKKRMALKSSFVETKVTVKR